MEHRLLKPGVENTVRIALRQSAPPAASQRQPPQYEMVAKNPDPKLHSLREKPAPQTREVAKVPPSKVRKQVEKLITTLATEQRYIIEGRALTPRCNPQLRQSKVRNCGDDESELWRAAKSTVYQGAFSEGFRHLNQGSEFRQDMARIDKLIVVQEAIYAMVDLTGSEPELLAQEQLEISREIAMLYAKHENDNLLNVLSAGAQVVDTLLEAAKTQK